MKNKKTVMMIVFILAIGIVILLLLLSCSKEYKVEFNVDSDVFFTANIHKGDTLRDVQNPVKEGYTFVGWYVDGELFSLDTPIEEDMVLEARFTKNTYTITIDLGDGSSIQTKEIEFEDTLEEPSTPKRTGYKFLGWYNGEEIFDFSSKITGNLSLEAKWEKINSVSTNSKEEKEETVKNTTFVVEHYLMDTNGNYPATPNIRETKEGKVGSEVEPAVKDFIGFISPKKKKITLKDKTIVVKYYYERKQFTLEVVGDQGVKETVGSGKYYYQSKVKVSVLLNSGYEVDKWSNSKQETSFDYEIGLKNEKLEVTTKLKEYQITYKLNGGKSSVSLEDKYTILTEISLGNPTKEGYDFKGWKVNGKDLEGNVIPKNTYYEDLVIEAIFEAREDTPYKVELYYMDTTGEYSIKETVDSELTKGTTDELPTYVPQNKAGFETPKLEGEKLPTIDGSGETVLTYYYERKQYPLTIQYQDSEVTITYDKKEKYYFEEKVNIQVSAKKGYHLLGDETLNYQMIDGENTITIESKGNSFTVNYLDEEGNPSKMESDTFVYGETYTLRKNTISKDPYTLTIKDYKGKGKDETASIKNNFIGWATKETGEKTYNDLDSLESYVPDKDSDTLNLYAVFETENYELKVPSIDGYEFKNFKLNGEEIPEEDYKEFKVEKSEEITVEWELVNYSIQYDFTGVEGVTCDNCKDATYTIEDEEKTLPTPTRPGYTFNGWVKNGTDELIKEIPKGSFGGLSLSLNEKSFTANENTLYKIEYYYMGKDGEYPTEPSATKEEHGVTDSKISFTPEVKEKGFENPVLRESATGEAIEDLPTIDGNGTTVLKYYYERKQFTLTVNTTSGIKNFTVDNKEYNESDKYYFEEEVSITSNAKDGYHLTGHELLKVALTNNDKTETFTYTIDDKDNEVTLNSAGNSFTVKYHDENGGNEKVEHKTYEEGITLDENTYTKDPYTLTIKNVEAEDAESHEEIEFQNEFVGWSTSNSSTDVTYEDEDTIIPENDGEEFNLYAVFETEKHDLEKLEDTEDYYFKDFEDEDGEDIAESELTDFTISHNEEITAHWLEVLSLEEWDSMVMDSADESMFNSMVQSESDITGYIKGYVSGISFSAKFLWLTQQLANLQTQNEYVKKISFQFGNGNVLETEASVGSTGQIAWPSGLISEAMKFFRNEIDGQDIKIVVYLDNEKVIAKDKGENLDYTVHLKTKTTKTEIDQSGTDALSKFNKTKPDLDIQSRDGGIITFRYNDPEATTYDAIFQMGVNTAIHKFFENEFVKNVEVTFMNDITSSLTEGITGKTMIVDRDNLSDLTWVFNEDINKFGKTGNYSYPVSELYANGDDTKRYKLKVKVNLYVDTDQAMPSEYTILFAPVEKVTYKVKYQKNGTGNQKEITCTVGEECELKDVVNVVTYYDNIENTPEYIIPKLTSCTFEGQDCQKNIKLENQKYVIAEDLTQEKNKEFTLNLTFEKEKLPSQDKNARGDEYIFGGFNTQNSTTQLESIIGYKPKSDGFVDEYTYTEPGADYTYSEDTTLYAIWWEKPYIDSISFGLYDSVDSLSGTSKQTSNVIVNKNKKAFYIEIPESDLIVYVPSLIVKTTTSIKLNPLDSDPSSTYAELWSKDSSVHIGDFSLAALPLSEEDGGKTWKASDSGIFGTAYQYVKDESPYPFSGSQFYHSLKNGITVAAFGPTPVQITKGRNLGIADKFGCNGLACTPHYGSIVSEHVNGNTYFFFATDENIKNTHTVTYQIGEETVCTITVPNDSPIPKISDNNNQVKCNGKTYTVSKWDFDFENTYATQDITITGTAAN